MTPAEHGRPRMALRVAVALALYKILVLFFALAHDELLPDFWSNENFFANFNWPPHEPPTRATRLATWDAQHYLFLATEGYGAGRRSITFFPLFPWLIRGLAALVPGLGPLGAALLVANACSIAGAALLYRFLAERFPDHAGTALLVLFAYPGALFFHFPYTESLFLLLGVGVLAALAHDRLLVAGGCAFLLALTRPNGVLIGAVLLWAAWVRLRRDRRLPPAHLLALAAPVLGIGVYLAYMQATSGGAFAGFDMQAAYDADRSLANLLDLPQLVRSFLEVKVWHGFKYSLLDRLAFVAVAATLVPLWRLDRMLFWYALPMALVGPLSGSFVSYLRFAAVVFPAHLVIARWLGGEARRPFLWLGLAVLYATQIVLLLRHTSSRWAG